MQNYSNKILN